MKNLKLFLIGNLWLILIAFGCTKTEDPCAGGITGPAYVLSDTTSDYFANYLDADRIIFENDLGEEVVFTVGSLTDRDGSYSFTEPCEADPSRSRTVSGVTQIVSLRLENPDLTEKPIFLYLIEFPETDGFETYESIEIYLGSMYFPDTPAAADEGDGLFFYKTNAPNDFATSADSLELNGRIFYDVIEYQGSGDQPKFELKYTKTEGIVYIRDTQDGREYVYKRKE